MFWFYLVIFNDSLVKRKEALLFGTPTFIMFLARALHNIS